MKKKVAIIIDNINAIGGTQTFSKNLKKILRNTYHVDIVSLLTKKDKKNKFLHLNLKKNIFILLFGFYIIYKLRKYNYCIIVSGQSINYFLIWGYGQKFIYRESNQPLKRISKQHFIKKLIQTFLYKIFITINKKSKFIAPSIYALKELKKLGVKKKRLYLIENPMPEKIKILSNLQKRVYNLVFSGRPTYTKGFDRVIKYANNGINIDYFGPNIKHPINNINYKGVYYNNILLNSKIIIIPSRFEGYPNIFLEALNSGCFVILSKELKWLLNNQISDFVYIIDNNNFKDLKKKLIIINRKIKTDTKRKLLNRIQRARNSLTTFTKYFKKIQQLFE